MATLMDDFLSCRFPSELILHVIRFLDCWDLVAMCRANPEWEALVEHEAVWQKAAQHRWPHAAGGAPLPPLCDAAGGSAVLATGAGPAPLALPSWVHALDGSSRWSLPTDREASRIQLPPPPPPPGAPGASWCKYYVTHDTFELMNLANNVADRYTIDHRLARLKRAMAWCAPHVDAASAASDDAMYPLDALTQLRQLTVACAPETLCMATAAMGGLRSLKRVALVETVTTHEHACEFVDSLRRSGAVLEALELTYATLGTASWGVVFGALRAVRTLHWLDSLCLAGCSLDDDLCIELCSALASEQVCLKSLDLSNNAITRVGVEGGLSLLLRSGAAASECSPGGSPARRGRQSAFADAGGAAAERPSAMGSASAPAALPSLAADAADTADGAAAANGEKEAALAESTGRGVDPSGGDERDAARAGDAMEVDGEDVVDGAPPRAPAADAPAATEARGASPDREKRASDAAGSAAASADGGAGRGGARTRRHRPPQLTSLDLSLNPLTADGTAALADALRANVSLESLRLQYVTAYTREPANLLGTLLGAECELTSLNLSFNYISACGAPVEQITAQLATNKSLKELRVRRCCIGGWRRARAIARGVMANTSLTMLDLSYNGLGAAQAAQTSASQLSLAVGTLCQAFAKNSTLRTVSLAHNALGDAGSQAILQAVLDGPSITALDLHSNGITAAGLQQLTAKLHTGGHSWLPLALHTHARHVRLARANAGAGVLMLQSGGGSTDLARAHPHADGDGLLFCLRPCLSPPPAPAGSAAAGAGASGEDGGGARRAPLCVDLQGNATLSSLLSASEDDVEVHAGARHTSPWQLAMSAPARRRVSVSAGLGRGAGDGGAARAAASIAAAGGSASIAPAAPNGVATAAAAAQPGAPAPPADDTCAPAAAAPAAPPRGGAAAAPAAASAGGGAAGGQRAESPAGAGSPEGCERGARAPSAEADSDDADGSGERGSSSGGESGFEPSGALGALGAEGGGAAGAAGAGGLSAVYKRKWDSVSVLVPDVPMVDAPGDEDDGAPGSRRPQPSTPSVEQMRKMMLRDDSIGVDGAEGCSDAEPSGAGSGPDGAAGAPASASVMPGATALARELRQLERARLPNPFYMARQREVNTSMRRILVDWLIELYEELQLPPHVLFAGVHAVDRYLSMANVNKECLQLVGAVALMLSSNNYCKLLSQDGDMMELRGLATAEDVVYWTDNTYTVDEVVSMEARLMHRLGIGMHEPVFAQRSPLHFLAKFSALVPLRDEPASVAHEILVRSTREYALLRFEPSLLAATALVVAVRSWHLRPLPPSTDGGSLAVRRGSPQRVPGDCTPDEQTLYSCTGHSALEVRRCEALLATSGLESPLACHSITSGVRASKTIVVPLDLRDTGTELPAPPFDASYQASL